mmetsp:Transcript_6561/g.17100  ORF Transcript_6561/g.17100 Transcript_6561/m.17100 type:complete len:161 (+) Transcript_6561:206-688(+)|eukprot:CAMPEP_0119188644 /NCGR_PEP_ID=MMETSP1316-20130426/171_1 /TAXON_ID=41880 /ORGANISM="Pycnococcus provasolii, Strain RCC2336" /LENGTH=160 /DNA_ID=CAMNT_0007183119 /DNA_START=178 /DNA_END=660 /DNA_ORIENTATION=+
MKPDWDKLGQNYKDSDSVMIVDVDCTAAGQNVCQKVGVRGYPTIKYYMAGEKNGKDYQGGRDFDQLKGFVESKLNKPVCNAVTKKGCAANEIAFIEKQAGKSKSEIADAKKEKEEELKTMKKELAEEKKAFTEKEKSFKKKEKTINKAVGILKQLEKAAK